MKKISISDREVIETYMETLNQVHTADKLGISLSTVKNVLARSLDEIEVMKLKRMKRLRVDSDIVLTKLVAMSEADILDIYDEDSNILPIKEWPLIWRQMVSRVESHEVIDKDGNMRGRVVKMNRPDVLKTIETLGKHVKVNAFEHKLQEESRSNAIEELKKARLRAFDEANDVTMIN